MDWNNWWLNPLQRRSFGIQCWRERVFFGGWRYLVWRCKLDFLCHFKMSQKNDNIWIMIKNLQIHFQAIHIITITHKLQTITQIATLKNKTKSHKLSYRFSHAHIILVAIEKAFDGQWWSCSIVIGFAAQRVFWLLRIALWGGVWSSKGITKTDNTRTKWMICQHYQLKKTRRNECFNRKSLPTITNMWSMISKSYLSKRSEWKLFDSRFSLACLFLKLKQYDPT